MRVWLLAGWLLLALPAARALPQQYEPADPTTTPRIGLVLSGGGARGLAHIGVLKVLERERVPVDLIAGTSMGAIVGGLYATGMTAAELEHELLRLDWAEVFARRVDRAHLPLRRKDEDFSFSAMVELGLRDGELRAPQGTVSARGLEVLLRRLTLPVRQLSDFAELPTPFRAVATDMESGEALVLEQGDLAQAMRASMSVPGVFAPIEWTAPAPANTQATPPGGAAALGGGPSAGQASRLLGDGGLVNNLPVDVARAMGAQRLIAVNVGTPLSPRKELGSLLGLTTQMVNILTEQNVKRSLAALWQEDLLISPSLEGLSSGEFERAADFIRAGEAAAEALLPQLRALALPPHQYLLWRSARRPPAALPPLLAAVRFEGSEATKPERYLTQLASRAGERFDAARAVQDTRLLAASGDYAQVDFRLEPAAQGDTLVFELRDKPWGPNYFRVGLDLSTDAAGASHFNLRLSHNLHWLNAYGGEWRNQLTIGRTPRLFSEIYQPLSRDAARDWFAAAWAEAAARPQFVYAENGQLFAELQRRSLTTGLDLGQPWGRFGELRLGWWSQWWNWHEEQALLEGVRSLLRGTQRIHGLRAQAQLDQLDDANFPREGWRLRATALFGQQRNSDTRVRRAELEATRADSFGLNTLGLQLRVAASRQGSGLLGGVYSLGGFQQLSGLRAEQLSGNALLFGRLSWQRRLSDAPVFTRGWFVGGSLEAGNTWQAAGDLSLKGLRLAGSAFIGADTGLGPLYLGIGSAQRGSTALYLFIGRP